MKNRRIIYAFIIHYRYSYKKISDLGGDEVDIYHIGTSEYEGTAFKGKESIAIDRNGNGGNLNTFRIWESNQGAISAFNIPGTETNGVILEPSGESTTISNKDKCIPAGSYNLIESQDREGAVAKNLSPLYDESYKYIELFFNTDIEKRLFYRKVIKITYECNWAADAVNYFQSFLMHYFKIDYEVVFEELSISSDEEISDFWKFCLFGPHPENKQEYYIELQTLVVDSYPKLKLLLSSVYDELLKDSKTEMY